MKASMFWRVRIDLWNGAQRGAVIAQRSMSEKLVRTRAKRSGNQAVLTKYMTEADDFLQRDELDTPGLQVIVEL